MDYEEHCRVDLAELGFDYDKMTPQQRAVVLEPIHSPESYYCDGEITSSQADIAWRRRLRNCGLSLPDFRKAVKIIN